MRIMVFFGKKKKTCLNDYDFPIIISYTLGNRWHHILMIIGQNLTNKI